MPIAGREFEVATASGVFSGDQLDRGTAVLLSQTPPAPPHGVALDIGCGWGPIALDLALRHADDDASHPEAESAASALAVWAIDVNERALALCRRNAERHAPGRIRAVLPEEVPENLRFDVIRSNPPIRIGKAALHELLERWLPRLADGGVAHLVVAKQLGSDSLQTWIAERFADEGLAVERTATAKGFRILRVERA